MLKIPNGWSNPLYLAPLFVSVVLTYGMFWFVWAYFGALIAFGCLAGPYVLAEITGALLSIRIRTILVFVAFFGSILCADMAVHMGELRLMAYYTKVLQPDETVKVVGQLHWSIYLRAIFVLVIALAMLLGSTWLPDPEWPALYASGAAAAIARAWASCCFWLPRSAAARPRSW